jgi:hypothetical protein
MSKRYKKVLVKQKNGRTVPITKLVKTCDACGNDMFVERNVKGGIHKRSRVYWVCSEKLCQHRELNEGSQDKSIRMGVYDDAIGILPLPDENEFST